MPWFQPKKPVAPEPEISVYHSVDDLPVSQAVVSLPVEEPYFREPLSPPGTKALSMTAVKQASNSAQERDTPWQQCVDGFNKGWNTQQAKRQNSELPRTGNNAPTVVVECNLCVPSCYCVIILVLLILLYRQP